MKYRSLSFFALAALSTLVVGCSDDDSGMSGSGSSNGKTYTCSASIAPIMLDYVVHGGSASFTSPDGSILSGTRSSSSDSVLGTWHFGTSRNEALHLGVQLDLTLESTRATVVAHCAVDHGPKATATATASAEVSATTVTFLGSDSRTITFK